MAGYMTAASTKIIVLVHSDLLTGINLACLVIARAVCCREGCVVI